MMVDKMLLPMWDQEADIVIVGSGFAGMAAAIEAKNAGSSVIILEKMKGYGGNSTISDGVVAAAATRMQATAGIADSPRLMYGDMLKAGLGLNQPELVRVLTENSAETFQWTIDYLGVNYLDRVDQFGGHSVPRSYTPHSRSGAAIIKQLLLKITDQEGIKSSGHPIERCVRKGVVKKFSRILEIAEHYNIPDQPLENTIAQFNTSVGRRLDQDFNKPILVNAQPLTHPPYYCIRLWPKVHHTMGGVLINANAQVLDLSLQAMKGLYAAGEVAGGIHGACRLGSCAIIDCLVFGRIAGRQAALI
jgi:succinate dehydrogenase/fumarate reductase flavoprotein subunit